MAPKKSIVPSVRISALEVIIICLICLCILLLVTNNVESFISMLYSPVAFLLLVVILVEYIILKSADRSRIYKIEVDKLRGRLIEHIKLFQSIEENLDEMHKTVDRLQDEETDRSHKEHVENLQERLKKVRTYIRSRL